jgi:hypothetical protein
MNQMLANDPDLVKDLLSDVLVCNDWTMNHPSIQVFSPKQAQKDLGTYDNFPRVRFLGIINGFFGTYDEAPNKGAGPIAVVYDDETGEIIRFQETRQ